MEWLQKARSGPSTRARIPTGAKRLASPGEMERSLNKQKKAGQTVLEQVEMLSIR